jgi:hypothetical protein
VNLRVAVTQIFVVGITPPAKKPTRGLKAALEYRQYHG